MGLKRRERGSWVALVAAYLVVFQSLLSAYATGVLAAPAGPDAFDPVICTAHGAVQAAADDDGSPDVHKAANCCQWGCGLLAAALPPREGAAGAIIRERPGAAAFFRSHIRIPASGREGSPGNPRAPPAAA